MAKYKAARTDAVSSREKEHLALVRSLAPQCMVLLENNGVLPLASPCPVALFGSGARRTVKGGTGSGDVNSRSVVNVEQGLKNAGFEIVTESWLDEYNRQWEEAQQAHMAKMKARIEAGENPIMVYFATPFKEPEGPFIRPEAAKAELAVYVISRNSGEGKDRDPGPGDYELSDREKTDLAILAEYYPKLVVLLNLGGVIDAGYFKTMKNLGALLLISQAGAVTGDAVADCLLGVTPPSGRLTDTWAKKYKNYPSSTTFGKNDGNTFVEPYGEGIFVGYRFFDGHGFEVNYPFGYGLGYTTFSMEPRFDEADAYGVSGKVKVTNTGSRPGREVIQVYAAPPLGRVRTVRHQLVAFAKTRLLEPGESQVIDISFPLKNMASYSEALAAWVLQPGKYYIEVGRNSRDYETCAAVEVEKTVVLEQLRNLSKFDPQKLSSVLGRVGNPDTWPKPDNVPVLKLDCDSIETQTHVYTDEDCFDTLAPADFVTMQDVLSGKHTAEELAAQLSVEELAKLCVGRFGDQSTIGAAGDAVPGAAGQTIDSLWAERGIGSLVLADGPAGLRLTKHFRTDKDGKILSSGGFFAMFGGKEEAEEVPADALDYYQFCTAIPIATMIAQSWDVDLARSLGRIVGREMAEYGVHSWLAPGMNIHRNPLCGRNFEYYSEDPLLSGMMAAADTLGVQETPGVGTTPKHFACNNQEDNRNYSDSIVSEQALREIYLRGFEICVRSAQPMFIMTSYNFINGVHAAMNRDTLTYALRNEWGFGGLVMTDWGTTGGGNLMEKAGEDSVPALCIAAGNDLIEPGNENDVKDIVASVEGKTDHPLSIASLRLCASRILRVIAGSSLYEGAKPWTDRFETDWFVTTK